MLFEEKGEYNTSFQWPLRPVRWKCRFAAVSEEERQHQGGASHLHIIVAYYENGGPPNGTRASDVIVRCFTWEQTDRDSRPTIQEIDGCKRKIIGRQEPRFAVSRSYCHAAVIVDDRVSLMSGAPNHYFCNFSPEPRGLQHLLCTSPTMLHLQVAPVNHNYPTCTHITTENCNDEDALQPRPCKGKNGPLQLAISNNHRYAVWTEDGRTLKVFRLSEDVEDVPAITKQTSFISKVEVVEDVAVVIYEKGHLLVYGISSKPVKVLFSGCAIGISSVVAISNTRQYIAVACAIGDDAGIITLLEWDTDQKLYKGIPGLPCRSRVRAMRFLEKDLIVVGKRTCYYYCGK